MIKRYYNNYKKNIIIKCISCIIIATLIILLMYNIAVVEISKPAKCVFSVAFVIPVLLIFTLIFLYCMQFLKIRRSIKTQDYQLIQKKTAYHICKYPVCASVLTNVDKLSY